MCAVEHRPASSRADADILPRGGEHNRACAQCERLPLSFLWDQRHALIRVTTALQQEDAAAVNAHRSVPRSVRRELNALYLELSAAICGGSAPTQNQHMRCVNQYLSKHTRSSLKQQRLYLYSVVNLSNGVGSTIDGSCDL
jgi:hypothetical protein